MPHLRIVGSVQSSSRDALRSCLLRCLSDFDVYGRIFETAGISPEDLARGDPLAVLRRLPLLDGEGLVRLMDESLRVGSRIVDLETSSGTTGPRVRRFISEADDVSDHELLAALFGVCGIGVEDRVACLDVDPVNLMVSFAKALDSLGVKEAYAYCVGPDFSRDMAGLRRLDPTVIITIPSILERCFESLEQAYTGVASPGLAKVVYFGEPSSQHTRRALESVFGVEVFGYYGATETSSLGIECSAHDGIHLFTDRNLIEIATDVTGGSVGQIVVTSLKQQTLPLLRYALKDVIKVMPGPCQCGLEYPRVEVLGRAGDSFSVLGLKIHYGPILRLVYEVAAGPGFMQLVLTRDDKDKLTIVLPEHARSEEPRITEMLTDRERELGFLVRGGYLGLEFSFVDQRYFGGSRKLRRVVDLRGTYAR